MLSIILYPSFFLVNDTAARFSDTVTVPNNQISTGNLTLDVDWGVFSPSILTQGASTTRTLTIKNTGTGNVKYRLFGENLDPVSCDMWLAAVVKVNGVIEYDSEDDIETINTPRELDAGDTDIIDIEIGLADNDPQDQNKSCDYLANIKAWQEGFAEDSGGFTYETSTTYTINTGSWVVLPSAPPVVEPNVVINEIMWMGSRFDTGVANGGDEWIELYNPSSQPVDISGWKIENIMTTNSILIIPNGSIIPAGGYFMISRYENTHSSSLTLPIPNLFESSLSIVDSYLTNGAIILKDLSDTVVDSTPTPTGSAWTVGINDSSPYRKWSMERNLVPGDGSLATSWHTCDRDNMSPTDLTLMKTYWKSNAQNYNCGTPMAPNLSYNDPTAPDYKGGGSVEDKSSQTDSDEETDSQETVPEEENNDSTQTEQNEEPNDSEEVDQIDEQDVTDTNQTNDDIGEQSENQNEPEETQTQVDDNNEASEVVETQTEQPPVEVSTPEVEVTPPQE